MSSSTSPSVEKPWFQDTKSGGEKQAHYFVRIRKLQDELIHREQHNLINAMERLKQLTYPRKKPVIRNFTTDSSSNPSSAQSFPARQLNLKKDARHRVIPRSAQTELKPLSGKPLMTKSGQSGHKKHEVYRPFFAMPPLLNDKDIAKIVHHANNTFPSQPSAYLLQPHLPSIPNVGRKTNFMVDNRLKLLTLTESEFTDPSEGSVSGMTKRLHTGKSQKRASSPKTKSKPNNNNDDDGTSGSKRKRNEKNILKFDVDPNDPVLFSHCVEDKKEGENWDASTPLPPPNSRPSTSRSGLVDSAMRGNCGTEITDRKQPETASNNKSDTASKGYIPIINIAFDEKESEEKGIDEEMTVLEDDEKSEENIGSSTVAVDLPDSAPDDSNQENGNQESIDIVETKVIITRKPIPSEEKDAEETSAAQDQSL